MAASDVWDYIFGSYVNAGVAALYITRRCYCDSKIEWLRRTKPRFQRREGTRTGEGGGEGRRGTRSMRSSRSEIILRKGRRARRGRDRNREFFSNFCPCVSDRRESLRLLSLEVVSSPLTYVFFFSLSAWIIESEGNLSPPYGRACKSSWYAGTDRLRVEDRYEYSRFDLEFNGTRSVDSIRVERCTGIILVSWSKIKSH